MCKELTIKYKPRKNSAGMEASVEFYNANDIKVGKISIGMLNKEALLLYTWEAKKGYGRKTLNCLLKTLLKQKLIKKNTSLEGMIQPIGNMDGNTYAEEYNKLNRIYRKLGFNVNNGFFSQTVNNLVLDNSTVEPVIPKKPSPRKKLF